MRNDISKTLKLAVAFAVVALTISVVACGGREREAKDNTNAVASNTNSAAPPTAPTSAPADSIKEAKETPVQVTAKSFNHFTTEHKKQECTLCHKRAKETATAPVFPYHDACNGCHIELSAATSEIGRSKLCIVCHQADPKGTLLPISRENASLITFRKDLKQFGLRGPSTGFKGFSHKDHMDPAKMPAGTEAAKCDDCHKVEGINASMPSHPECYKCHTHQKDQKFGACNVCHTDTKEGVTLQYSRSVGSSYTFANFKHSSHGPRVIKGDCDRCHRLLDAPPAPTRSDILAVSTSRGQRHNSSCFSCHSRQREVVCSKCHLGGPPSIAF
jgi:hypothetical protein